MTRILIAGLGSVVSPDSAFGVEVARRLARRRWPEGVRVMDAGLRGIDVAYALAESADVAILVESASRGRQPGTVYCISHNMDDPAWSFENADRVLGLTHALGGILQEVLLVGCEPGQPATPAVVTEAADQIETLVARIRAGQSETVPPVIADPPVGLISLFPLSLYSVRGLG